MQCLQDRQREMSEYLKNDIGRIISLRTSQVMEHLYANKDNLLQSLVNSVESTAASVHHLIANGKKQKIRYMQFSFLLSNALTRELRFRIDFYDARYYSDITDIGGYWDYSELFGFIDEDIEFLHMKLSEKFARIKEYELVDIRMVYHIAVFAIMEMVLTELVSDIAFAQVLTEIFEPEIYVFYGAYMDQSKLTAKVRKR